MKNAFKTALCAVALMTVLLIGCKKRLSQTNISQRDLISDTVHIPDSIHFKTVYDTRIFPDADSELSYVFGGEIALFSEGQVYTTLMCESFSSPDTSDAIAEKDRLKLLYTIITETPPSRIRFHLFHTIPTHSKPASQVRVKSIMIEVGAKSCGVWENPNPF